MENFCSAEEVTDDNNANALLHAGYLRLQTHSQNT